MQFFVSLGQGLPLGFVVVHAIVGGVQLAFVVLSTSLLNLLQTLLVSFISLCYFIGDFTALKVFSQTHEL